MTAYESGRLVGQAIGYLLVAGICIYFLYRQRKKGKKKEDDNNLDQV